MSDNTYFYCHVEGNTDVGCKRKANEDWLDSFECENGLVAVVCDGMGGHVGGQIASHVAVDAIRRFLSSKYIPNPKDAIVEACHAANAAILQRASEQPELTGMGSTCVMLIVRDGKVYMGSVGDSRIYLVRSKTIRQLTKDQSYVQMLVDAGQITQEQAEHHPRKNEITNALGLSGMQPATVLEDPINPEAGDCFVLCSDGLSGMVPDREIAKVVSNQMGMSQQERVNTLIDKARRNGGLDNITCQIVEFAVTPSGSAKPVGLKKRLIKYGLPVVGSLVLISCLSLWAWNHFRQEKGEREESEHVEHMRKVAKYTSPKPEATIVFSNTAKKVLEIEEVKDFGLRFYVYNPDGSVDTINKNNPLSLSTLSVYPADSLSLERKDNRCSIAFKCRDYTEPDMTVELKDTDDSTYCYVFAVTGPVKRSAPSESGTSLFPPRTPEKDSGEAGQVLVDITTPQEGESDEGGEGDKGTLLSYTIPVALSEEKTITLYSNLDGTNTQTEIYLKDYAYAFKAGKKTTDWYELTNDGAECVIKVKGKKIPSKDNFIDIPTQEEGKVIRLIFQKQRQTSGTRKAKRNKG